MARRLAVLLAALVWSVAARPARARDAGENAYLVADGKTIAQLGAGSHTDPVRIDCVAGRIYRFDYPRMICTDFGGKTLWTHKLKMRRGEWVRAVFRSDPRIVCVWIGGRLVGLDKATGQVAYRTDADAHWSRVRRGAVYLVGYGGSDQLRRLDPATGKIAWSARLVPGEDTRAFVRHLHADHVVGSDMRLYYFDPETGKPPPIDVEPSKTRRLIGWPNGFYRLQGNRLRALPRNGGPPLWSVPAPAGADRLLEPVAYGRLVVGNQRRMHVIDTETKKTRFAFDLEQKYVLPEMIQTKNAILLGNRSGLRCLDPKTGAERWRTRPSRWTAMLPGPDGVVLHVHARKIVARDPPTRNEGRVVARRITDGKALWTWVAPPFRSLDRLYAGIEAEPCRGKLLIRVKWHVLD